MRSQPRADLLYEAPWDVQQVRHSSTCHGSPLGTFVVSVLPLAVSPAISRYDAQRCGDHGDMHRLPAVRRLKP
jgi:hypothetical protein